MTATPSHLPPLTLDPEAAAVLSAADGDALISFLLRWEHYALALQVLDVLREVRPGVVALLDAMGIEADFITDDDLHVEGDDVLVGRAGYDGELDEVRALRDQSRRVIAGMERDLAEETGIRSLKIRHNNVLGYYIEITANHAAALTEGEAKSRFIHRQTMANALRFTTRELSRAPGLEPLQSQTAEPQARRGHSRFNASMSAPNYRHIVVSNHCHGYPSLINPSILNILLLILPLFSNYVLFYGFIKVKYTKKQPKNMIIAHTKN